MTGMLPSMAEALRLTRAGRLVEAAALLRGGAGAMAAAATPGAVIDLVAEPATPAAGPSRAGSFVERCHNGKVGALGYRLYVPPGAGAGLPLVVMLHGCTQTPEDFARGTGMNRLADELGFLVAYPRQTASANAQKCWNWFKPGDQQRDRGEPALIAGMTREIVAEQRADPARVYVAGLSAGGAAAAIMGSAYPDVFAAIGVHSGLACGAAHDLSSALAAMKQGGAGARGRAAAGRFVPVITFHGDRDRTVAEINSREINAAARAAAGGALATSEDTGTGKGGRRYTRLASRAGDGRSLIEQWTVHGAGHAWSGGDGAGSYADADGPDASREMLRFFLQHRLAG